MAYELVYTSVPKGLRPGSRGFCTVAMTAGLAANVAERLELLSGYRPLFPPGDARAGENPTALAHWHLTVGPTTYPVLSRVSFAGVDYTRRANKLAHHIVLAEGERDVAGPAALLQLPGLMRTTWSAEPAYLPRLTPGDAGEAATPAWAGDAKWPAALAATVAGEARRRAFLVFKPPFDPMPLIGAAVAALPAPLRWQATFNSYFTELPAGVTCQWRAVVADTPAAREAARDTNALVIDLTK